MKTQHKMTAEELATVRELLIIWRSCTGLDIYPSSGVDGFDLQETLLAFFRQYFNSEMGKWKKFVLYATESKFLMGKATNFKATLEWVLREKILMRIVEGYYHSEQEKRAKKRREKLLKEFWHIRSDDQQLRVR